MLKRKLALLVLLVIILLAFNTFSTFAELDEIKLSFSQGENKEIDLESKSQKVIGIDFISIKNDKLMVSIPKEQEPGVYFGSIFYDWKEVPIAIDVNEKDALSRIGLILKDKEIEAGNNLNFNLDIKVLKPIIKTSININYKIKKIPDALILEEQRSKIISSSEILFDSIYLPSFLDPGKHVLIAKTNFEGKTVVASEFFEVKESELVIEIISKTNMPFIIFVAAITLLLLFVLFYIKNNLDFITKRQPINLNHIYKEFVKTRKAEEAFAKLDKQSELLNRAYKLGSIDKKLYEKARKKIVIVTKKIDTRFGKRGYKKSAGKIEKLKQELELLEKAYKLKSIKKSRYDRTRKRILNALSEYDFNI